MDQVSRIRNKIVLYVQSTKVSRIRTRWIR